MMAQIKVISDKQAGKVETVDPEAKPAQAAVAGIDPDEHFELKDKVETLSQELENVAKSIKEINK